MNKIKKVEIDNDGHVIFWFFDSEDPWDVTEFETGSETRKRLEEIIDLVLTEG